MSGRAESTRRTVDIAVFLGLVVVFSAPLCGLLIHTGRLDVAHGRAIHLLMWAPGLAAIAACAIRGIPLARLGWSWCPARWEWMGWGLPVAYGLAAYALMWAAGVAPFTWQSAVTAARSSTGLTHGAYAVDLLLLMTYGLVNSLASALGEEIGWRGYLLPALNERLGYRPAVLVSGVIWASWHVPVLLFAGYNGGTAPWYELTCFTVMIVATGTMAGWLRLRSGSVWPAAMLHASHNLWIQQILDPLSQANGRSAYWTGEFGAGLALVTAGIAWGWFRNAPRFVRGDGDVGGSGAVQEGLSEGL